MDHEFFQMFKLGLKRDPGSVMPLPPGVVLNIGCGKAFIVGTISVDHPSNNDASIKWDADQCMSLPAYSDSVAGIHCYHFLEHCQHPAWVLKEFQRVLKPGGRINLVVPYYSNQLAIEDLDHKHSFCEGTWKTLFNNNYYDKNNFEWRYRVNFNLIVGVAERNLCLMTQLEKF